MEQGYEMIYYLQNENRRFAVVKFHPHVVEKFGLKSVVSGRFQFAIAYTSEKHETFDKLRSKLSELIEDEKQREELYNFLFDEIMGLMLDGFTFELSVEEALYLANILAKHVDEDYETLREIRANLMFEEEYKSKDPDPNIY